MGQLDLQPQVQLGHPLHPEGFHVDLVCSEHLHCPDSHPLTYHPLSPHLSPLIYHPSSPHLSPLIPSPISPHPLTYHIITHTIQSLITGLVTALNITSTTNTTVSVRWAPPTVTNGPILGYAVQVNYTRDDSRVIHTTINVTMAA